MYLRFVAVFIILICVITPALAQKPAKDSLNSKSDSIINEVKIFAERDNFFSKLVRNFLVIERKAEPSSKKKLSNRSYEEYEGKIIRNINITVLEVFGTSLTNPKKVAESWLEKAGNKVHKNTKEWVIKQRLLFKKGEGLDPLLISETERILRQYKNTYDARIMAKRIPQSRDSIDLLVIVQDVWSITGSGSFSAGPTGSLGLKDVNFLGLGNELAGQVFYNNRDSIPWHYLLEYTNYNIANTFITGNLYYKNLSFAQNYGIGINRDFFSPTIKWAGGISLNWLKDKIPVYDNDSTIVSKGYNNNQQDFWLGRAFNLMKKKNENTYFVAGRILRTDFTKAPPQDSFKISFQDYTLHLISLGYSYQRFIKDNYIFGLGRTEDIPVGKKIALTLGYEDGEYFKRPYFGARAGISHYSDKYGYISASLEFGSYRFNNQWQDEVISSEILYYSKLISLGTWRWRNFFWNRVTYGYNTAPGKILNINKREGIRGFSGGYVFGNKKYVINYESVFYTPFNILGFRTAFMFFADFAFIGKNEDPLFQGKFYQAYGIGFRFRNEHLIFRTIQLTLGYYPNTKSSNQETFSFFEESRAFYQFTNYQFLKPRPLEF